MLKRTALGIQFVSSSPVPVLGSGSRVGTLVAGSGGSVGPSAGLAFALSLGTCTSICVVDVDVAVGAAKRP